ncbi:MAG: universal stress protein [Pseudomonadota bacterium]
MSVTVMLGGKVEEIEPAIETAIHLTQRMKTTLTGLCAMPDPASSVVYITGAETVIMGSAAIQSLSDAQDKLVADFQQKFADETTKAGPWLQAEFTKEVGSVASHGAAAASLADAIVLPKGATDSTHPLNAVFEHVLMEAGLPLVLASNEVKTSDTCLIAWDGSPLTARAVRLHLPLIRSFKKVVIVQNTAKLRHCWAHVCQASKDRLVELLQEERLDVSVVNMDGAVSDGIVKASSDHDASLIVMGAYGHNRIGQLLFGGTTSRILHSEGVPTLALCR